MTKLPAPPPRPQECRISGKAGFSKEITYGGGIYPLPLTSIPFNWWGNDNQPSP